MIPSRRHVERSKSERLLQVVSNQCRAKIPARQSFETCRYHAPFGLDWDVRHTTTSQYSHYTISVWRVRNSVFVTATCDNVRCRLVQSSASLEARFSEACGNESRDNTLHRATLACLVKSRVPWAKRTGGTVLVTGQGWRAVGFPGPSHALPCTSAISSLSHTSGRRIFGINMNMRRACDVGHQHLPRGAVVVVYVAVVAPADMEWISSFSQKRAASKPLKANSSINVGLGRVRSGMWVWCLRWVLPEGGVFWLDGLSEGSK